MRIDPKFKARTFTKTQPVSVKAFAFTAKQIGSNEEPVMIRFIESSTKNVTAHYKRLLLTVNEAEQLGRELLAAAERVRNQKEQE